MVPAAKKEELMAGRAPHLGYFVSGRMAVRMDSGEETSSAAAMS